MKINISSTLMQAAERCAADYTAARGRGDLETAMVNVQKCIFIYGKLAESNPFHPLEFQKKVKEWKAIASSLGEEKQQKARQQIPVQPPEPLKKEVATGQQTGSKTPGPEPSAAGDQPKSGPQVETIPMAPEPLKAADAQKKLPDTQVINEQFWHDIIPGASDIRVPVIDAVYHIALEIAREGREGRPVGTAFLVGDADAVLGLSRQLILNPFQGHKEEDRSITNPEMKECIKELAQLDGAFIVRGDGIVEAAARYITMDTSKVMIPPGHGTRHSSIAAVTQETKAIGIIVSQSGGKISFIKEGKIFRTIHP
jgi:hypothetical protein